MPRTRAPTSPKNCGGVGGSAGARSAPTGTLGRRFKRRNTKRSSWPEAKAVVAEWESRGSWDAPDTVALEAALAPDRSQPRPSKPSVTIQLAADAYLANRAGLEIAPATLRKYKTLTDQIRAFAAAKGNVMLDQFEITDLDDFYLGWKDGVRWKDKKLERLKGFFNFCVRRKWIAESPASDLEALSARADPPIACC